MSLELRFALTGLKTLSGRTGSRLGWLLISRNLDRLRNPSDRWRRSKKSAGKRHVSQRLNILIAEDNATNRLILSQLLKDDHDIEFCDNGKAAVDAAERRIFDLILMDIHMPVLNGLEATEAIRATGNNVPIIALTADKEFADAPRSSGDGVNGIVLKPISIPELFDAIARHARVSVPSVDQD
jgi:CheY-like chemotaxis protein